MATWRLTVQFLLPHVNRNPRSLRFFFSHSKNIFCRFVPKSVLHPCPVSVNSYPDFFSISYSSLRKHTFFNNSNLISFLAFIVNLNTFKVFLGFRFRLKWVFRQYGSEVIEFWRFNVEREMKKNTHWKWFVFVANGKNQSMNECMNEWFLHSI